MLGNVLVDQQIQIQMGREQKQALTWPRWQRRAGGQPSCLEIRAYDLVEYNVHVHVWITCTVVGGGTSITNHVGIPNAGNGIELLASTMYLRFDRWYSLAAIT